MVIGYYCEKRYCDIAHQGVLQLCVRVRDLAPSRWNIRSTARLVPIEWPDSTVIRLAILPAECAATMSTRSDVKYARTPS